ncbi:MAG TPA: dTMP kinase [Buchnera sp. (in: enterobacteria)]|nr:dTMP kinase [Buchnera sp. (in: enterobacteria)]
MYAARIQLIENVIKPSLKKGTWVISDRHDLSSFAYQGGGCHINHQLITTLHTLVIKDFYPNLIFYLDVDPKISLQRIRLRGALDRIENKDINFFIRTRNEYLRLIKNKPNIITINANLAIHIVENQLKQKLKQWLKNSNAMVSMVNKNL